MAGEDGDIIGRRLMVKAQDITLEAPTEEREETKGHLVIQKDLLSIQRGFCAMIPGMREMQMTKLMAACKGFK